MSVDSEMSGLDAEAVEQLKMSVLPAQGSKVTADELVQAQRHHVQWTQQQSLPHPIEGAIQLVGKHHRFQLARVHTVRHFKEARFCYCDFSSASRRRQALNLDFTGALFRCCTFSDLNLARSIFNGAQFQGCSFLDCGLTQATFCNLPAQRPTAMGLRFYRCNLTEATFVGSQKAPVFHQCTGLDRGTDVLASLEVDPCGRGLIAYKTFGTYFESPGHWEIKQGAVLTESVNRDPWTECACGVNICTAEWLAKTLRHEVGREYNTIWRVLIEWADLGSVVVPHRSDGKFRAARVRLLSELDRQVDVCDPQTGNRILEKQWPSTRDLRGNVAYYLQRTLPQLGVPNGYQPIEGASA